MKIINNSGNTIYLQDLDMHLPYSGGEVKEIDADILKKSKSLRSFIVNRMLDVVEYDSNEKIEASIMFLRDKTAEKFEQKSTPEPEEENNLPEVPINDNKIEVKIHGLFYDAGGYAKVNRNLARMLNNAGFKVKISSKRGQNQLKEDELRPFTKLEQTKLSRNHILIDSIVPSFAELSSGKYRVLYTTIESYTVPDQFIDCCQMYNEAWTTSEWSSSILRELIDIPVYTVPTGVNQTLYTEEGDKFDFKPDINNFVFLSVFGWNYRKGYDVLLKAYFDEFKRTDNVSLLITSRYQGGTSKFHKNKIKDDIEKIMTNFPNKDLPHVVRYSQVIPEQDMPKLYRAANAFILPTRGEGGCLTSLEASLCGLPVIMTNCSGQQGYLRADNSYMIQPDHLVKMQPGQSHIHYWDGQKFPALTSENVHNQTKRLMREVYENINTAKKRNKNLQQLILQKFTWNSTANAAISRLKEIAKKIRN